MTDSAMTPTPEQRAAWQRLAEKASPGPWFVFVSPSTVQVSDSDEHRNQDAIVHWAGFDASEKPKAANARFIAAAREAVPSLLSALSTLEEERDALKAEQMGIRELHAVPGKLEIALEGDTPKLIAAAFAQMFRDSGAANYLEMKLGDPKTGERFTVTAQRALGKTPHELRREAEEERDRLREWIAMLPPEVLAVLEVERRIMALAGRSPEGNPTHNE